MRIHDNDGPAEQALIRAVAGQYEIESRSAEKPPLLNEKQEPVVEPRVLTSNSVILVHRAQLLFLYDFDRQGRPIADPLAALSRKRLLNHVADQCSVSLRSIRELVKDRSALGQNLGEILVEKGITTPLFWRVLCTRLLDQPARKRRFRFWSQAK